MGRLLTALFGALLLSTGLMARQKPVPHYPPHDPFKAFDAQMAHAKTMSAGCPKASQMQCPTPNFKDLDGDWPCVTYIEMCDGKNDCPQGEDEHAAMCMYHNMIDGEMQRIKQILKAGTERSY